MAVVLLLAPVTVVVVVTMSVVLFRGESESVGERSKKEDEAWIKAFLRQLRPDVRWPRLACQKKRTPLEHGVWLACTCWYQLCEQLRSEVEVMVRRYARHDGECQLFKACLVLLPMIVCSADVICPPVGRPLCCGSCEVS